jgi:hypothetical protein
MVPGRKLKRQSHVKERARFCLKMGRKNRAFLCSRCLQAFARLTRRVRAEPRDLRNAPPKRGRSRCASAPDGPGSRASLPAFPLSSARCASHGPHPRADGARAGACRTAELDHLARVRETWQSLVRSPRPLSKKVSVMYLVLAAPVASGSSSAWLETMLTEQDILFVLLVLVRQAEAEAALHAACQAISPG